eukprot:CAMPEP_0172439002 /NCGR_PEP_ID=MMETSP1065-20121228/105_1 /TAXON_ID=265537 /ORGANISM="Amphiprora paludosa, Strain CCMP125" /LENGTH=269 /DNA_ID=CAMNT_0013187619 /DNA_START=55 /DNA_END=864 /DNA_ORIENTATION=+
MASSTLQEAMVPAVDQSSGLFDEQDLDQVLLPFWNPSDTATSRKQGEEELERKDEARSTEDEEPSAKRLKATTTNEGGPTDGGWALMARTAAIAARWNMITPPKTETTCLHHYQGNTRTLAPSCPCCVQLSQVNTFRYTQEMTLRNIELMKLRQQTQANASTKPKQQPSLVFSPLTPPAIWQQQPSSCEPDSSVFAPSKTTGSESSSQPNTQQNDSSSPSSSPPPGESLVSTPNQHSSDCHSQSAVVAEEDAATPKLLVVTLPAQPSMV